MNKQQPFTFWQTAVVNLRNRVSIHYTQIGRYESKGAQPSAEVLTKLATELEVSADYLMSGSTNEQAVVALEDKQLLQQFRKVELLPSDKKLRAWDKINNAVNLLFIV